ncbi:MAG: hypothetical protein J5509_04515 [Lachnospiraceae bacterium]|nr:hypothetical protein [Lachnospiraceae bacterium]
METEKVIKEMENRGYTVSDESGVLMFTGLSANLEESIAAIKKDLESLGFGGSWGTKGYPKGKVPKTVTAPVQSAPPVTVSADEETEAEAAFEESVTDEPDISGSDFTQMTFDFT